jgi:hypothetical protein
VETFSGWQKNRRAVKDVEKSIFDKCFETFSRSMEIKRLSSFTEELMKFVVKYRA